MCCNVHYSTRMKEILKLRWTYYLAIRSVTIIAFSSFVIFIYLIFTKPAVFEEYGILRFILGVNIAYMIYSPFLYVGGKAHCSPFVKRIRIKGDIIVITNILGKTKRYDIREIQYIGKNEGVSDYVVYFTKDMDTDYTKFRIIPTDSYVLDKYYGVKIAKLKDKVYNKEHVYVISRKKIDKIKKDIIFIEPDEEWRSITRRRNRIRLMRIFIILTYIPGLIKMFQLYPESKNDITWQSILLVFTLVAIGGFLLIHWLLMLTQIDLYKHRQRFIITKEDICPPWKKPHIHYDYHLYPSNALRENKSTTFLDNHKVCIPLKDISKIFLGDRHIIRFDETINREVWIIKTVDECEYYILPRFKKRFLEVLDQIAIKKEKNTPQRS